MTKIASVLRIGPKIITPFGYDIIIINKKVIFSLKKMLVSQHKDVALFKLNLEVILISLCFACESFHSL